MACIFEFVMQPIHTHNPAPAHTCYSILSAKALITNKSSVQIDFWEKKKKKQLVPSKLAPVSEVSDKKKKKKSSLPYILSQKYMPNPTVLLASSTSLLHLMPIQQCGKRTKSFDSFGRRGAESSWWVAKGLPQDSLVVGKQVDPGSGACINRPMGCRQQSRTDKGLLMVPATSFQMLQKLSHFLKAAPV